MTAKKGYQKKGTTNGHVVPNKVCLPYDPNQLVWDSQHRTNDKYQYCYCGKNGQWFFKMVQCCRCKQWFHEACLQCLDYPLLLGDRFYILVCSVCTNGPEYLCRLDLNWVDIVHLTLYNLLHQFCEPQLNQQELQYFDVDTDIVPFLFSNWTLYQLRKRCNQFTRSQIRDAFCLILRSTPERFKCGKEDTLWTLCSSAPPPAPTVTIPKTGSIPIDIMNSLYSGNKDTQDSEDESVNTPTVEKRQARPSRSEEPIARKKSPDDDRRSPVYLRARNSKPPQPAVNTPTKSLDVSSPNKPSTLKGGKSPKKEISEKHGRGSHSSRLEMECEADTSSREILNSIIPPPNNFEGNNNPFRSPEFFNHHQNHNNHSFTNGSNKVNKKKLSLEDIWIAKDGSVRRKRKHHSKLPKTNTITMTTPPESGSSIVSTSSESMDSLKANNGESSKSTTAPPTPSRMVESSCSIPFNDDLSRSVNTYFGAENRIANGDEFNVLAKRITQEGQIQYLLEWLS